MNELEKNLNSILEEKNAKLLPKNIKKGVYIFGIEGTYEGLNTSDATVKAEDILEGKVAYANGERIVGTLKI